MAVDVCDCDLVVIGAGPAGLSTAVYAGAEECSVRLLDAGDRPGGQAGQSTKIRNYFGFPDGVTGPQLAGLGVDGALSFGVDLRSARVHHVERIMSRSQFRVTAEDETFTARAVVIATGATPRRHKAPGVAAYHGRGVYYRGPDSEHPAAYSGVAFVIGGGNSAGQAATFLARCGCEVHIVVRSGGLAASMSRYLIAEIEASDAITLHTHTTVERVLGGRNRRMRDLLLSDKDHPPDDPFLAPCNHVFMLIGSDPNTSWLRGTVALDAKGHILTGADVSDPASWKAERGRAPFPHETSVPGIFAAGDVRDKSLKRVAAAVGEGAGAYFDVHRYLNA